MDESPVVCEHLTKRFQDLVAVNGLDLEIMEGVLYGLIGPNGSGKTTTIRMLVGLTRPSGGIAALLGEKVPVKENRGRIGYMPQEMSVHTDLTVMENLEFFAGLYSLRRSDFRERAEWLLDVIDLADRRDSMVKDLSGGMKHRVSLACALVHDPDLLFLDEPTVGVDPELRKGFWDYFRLLEGEGKTVVITTHYMDEALRCSQVGMMRNGELIAEGTPESLMRRTGVDNLEDAFLAHARRCAE